MPRDSRFVGTALSSLSAKQVVPFETGRESSRAAPPFKPRLFGLPLAARLYLPTRRTVRDGGYSARIVDGVVGPEGGDVLVDETVKALNEMRRD